MLPQGRDREPVVIEIGKAGFEETELIVPVLEAMKYPKILVEILFDDAQGNELFSIAVYCLLIRNLDNLVLKYKDKKNSEPCDLWQAVKRKIPAAQNEEDVIQYLFAVIGRQAPLMIINRSTLEALHAKREYPVPESEKTTFDKIYENNINKKIAQEDVTAVHLRNSLQALRERMYSLTEMEDLLSCLPTLARILFVYFDYAYRVESAESLVSKIKEKRDRERLTRDHSEAGYFLEAYRHLMDQKSLQEGALQEDGLSTRTMLLLDNTYLESADTVFHLHPFVQAAALDLCVIADGLLQIIENIVLHAAESGQGQGLLSVHLRNDKKDGPLLDKRYGKKYTHASFYLEIVLADLSDTNIPDKFRENNSAAKGIEGYDDLCLRSFFNPDEDDRNFWSAYYKIGENVVHHFGLQIFDSVVTSKSGRFGVVSGMHKYSRDEELQEKLQPKGRGTTYNILLPMTDTPVFRTATQDAALSFDLKSVFSNRSEQWVVDFSSFNASWWSRDKAEIINDIRDEYRKEAGNAAGEHILICAVQNRYHMEYLIKGALLYLFSDVNVAKPPLKNRLAFIGCTESQFMEILRMVLLYYNKHGVCKNMANTELYIREQAVGQEIVIFGESLDDIRKVIIKASALRGFLPRYIDATNRLLTRKEGRQ